MSKSAQRSVSIAFLWMVGAVVSFSLVAISARGLAARLNVFETLAARNLGGILILLAAIPFIGSAAQLRAFRFDLHLIRNFVHFVAQAAWIYAVIMLPLSFVFALEFTTPAWTAVFAFLFLREHLNMARIIAIFLGFVGALVIVRPGLQPVNFATIMGLSAAIGFGIQITITKKLTATNTTWCILFWMNLMQLPMNLAANVVVMGEPLLFWHKIDAATLWPLAGICICGLSAHFCLTNAFHHGDAVVIAPMDFMRVPVVALAAYWLYGEGLDGFVALGALIIMAGILGGLLAEKRRRNNG